MLPLTSLWCVGFVLQGRLSSAPHSGLRGASHTSVLMSTTDPEEIVRGWLQAVRLEEEIVRVAIAAGREAADVVVARLGADVLKTKASRGDLLTAADAEVQDLIERHVAVAFPSHTFLGEESVAAGAVASAAALGATLDTAGEYLWIVDPIDGTTNFVQSLPLVGISIGVAKREASGWELCAGVIVDPFRGEVFAARRGAGATLNGEPICVGSEELGDAVVATGFAPTQESLQPMLRGMATVGRKARTLRMLGSAAIMLAWVACGRLSAYFEADLNSWDSAAGVRLCRLTMTLLAMTLLAMTLLTMTL